MADDLTEIRERLQFCRTEISSLDREVQAYCRSAVEFRQDQRMGLFFIYATLLKKIPTGIRSRAGTTANEIRSCLDALASQLAIRNKRSTNGVYFPISRSKDIFDTDGMEKIRKLSTDDQNKIIALNPYAEANPKLFGLHEADRTRKHTKLVGDLVQKSVGFGSGQIGFLQTGDHLGKVGEEVEIARGTGVTAQLFFRLDVHYSEPMELEGQPIVKTLNDFVTLVEDIVSRFE